MPKSKTGSKKNIKGALDQYITSLQSESKLARKQAFQNVYNEIFEKKNCDPAAVFPEIYAHILKGFSDPSEGCREISAMTVASFIEQLPLNDYYLTYIIPVIVRRIGSPEIVEESEEIRLLLIELVSKIVKKYQAIHFLTPFLNDFTSILMKTCTDPFPKVKLEACECIILLSKIIEKDFHTQSESFVKPVLTNFSHQHFRVRAAAVRAIGAIVMVGNAKCFELSITPMAEKLFDENAQVRLQVTQEVGNWMLNYRDRYSFWHRMIPLLLTSLSDAMADVRDTATNLWADIGKQYTRENEKDLKKKLDFHKDVPTHYPDIKRPNLGCRVLVQSNLCKIVPAIAREMDGWQSDARLRVAQLLCWLILCAEDGFTQHANSVASILKRGAGDDDARVVLEVKRASELYGYFIEPVTWWKFFETDLDSSATLLVLANILKGSRVEQVKYKVMQELSKELADPDRCRIRKVEYQTSLIRTTEALMDLCKEDCVEVAEKLFVVNFTIYAMPAEEKIGSMAQCNLDKLMKLEGCNKNDLYIRHTKALLMGITTHPTTWTLLSPERCLLECVLLNAGPAIGFNFLLVTSLLRDCLATPKVDPEVKLRIFTALSTALFDKRNSFSRVDEYVLQAFLAMAVNEMIMPNLVWAPGKTAEAIRTAALACLCSVLQDPNTKVESMASDEDYPIKRSKVFAKKEHMQEFLDRVVPFLVGLGDDNSLFTRKHTLRALRCVGSLAALWGCFSADLLHKMYFVVLKRLDDSSDIVRSYAVQTVQSLFANRPRPYDTAMYSAHVDALYSAMLIHLDDPDDQFREEMLGALIFLSEVDPVLLAKKIKSNSQLYRNKAAFDRLSRHIEEKFK